VHDDRAPLAREADRHGVGAVVAGERDVVRHEEPGRRALEDASDRRSSWRSVPARLRTSTTPPGCA
jgi:hypothetical protein